MHFPDSELSYYKTKNHYCQGATIFKTNLMLGINSEYLKIHYILS